MRVESRLLCQVGGQIPVMPAMVSAEQDFVAACGAARDSHGHRARFAATFRVTHHLRARYRRAQRFGQLNFQLMVDRIHRAQGNLSTDRLIDHWIGVAQQDRTDATDPVDVLEAIEVPEPRAARPHRIDRRHTIRHSAGPTADQLCRARNQRCGSFVHRHRLRYASRALGRSHADGSP